jgi:acetyltransferase-like isoleucine patch superfamily enzyme
MTAPLGVPPIVQEFLGIDIIGPHCRIDETVTVMRFGHKPNAIQLAEQVSLYAHNRLVLSDSAATDHVGIHIGPRTIVNAGGYLSGEGGLRIGADVLIGPHVKILSAGHAIDNGRLTIAHNPITRAGIHIEDGAWVGAGATILEGTHIGQGAVIGAGSVVRGRIPSGAIYAGVPARFIRWREGIDGFHAPERSPSNPNPYSNFAKQLWSRIKSSLT